ncbi:MAG TPA: UvrD-helicase domain-containing protein [Egicoccus sp.]|nr:UvrD-helicase domain-containing protein [Egicoccus sp.]HSK23758.1 UvrD-helicase domain-containing protein [Egicoccus sp.]
MTPPETPAPGEPTPLRLDDPLPTGTVVLEASAGTGKTFTIAALVTRAVAEGRCSLQELLVVTFTRAATAELRERVRSRLVEAADHVGAAVQQAPEPPARTDDPVLDGLVARDDPALAADPDELTRRRDRLRRAVADFDAATISTIHGFTQQVLRSVGLSADVDRDPELLEDTSELLEEVVDDVYARRYLHLRTGGDDPTPRLTRTVALQLAEAVVGHADAEVVPDPAHPDPDAAERAALARELRAEVAARKRRRGLLAYDDLLLALREALQDPVRGDTAVATLRERYRFALVDEFQDTDPVQWDILARAFRDPDDPDRALVLIGDPKQAIYAFRGADVQAYLAATRVADRRHTLQTNFRTDAPLLDALDALLRGTTFGDADITFRSVAAADHHREGQLDDPRDPAPLQVRTVSDTPSGGSAESIRQHIAHDVAATVVDLLPAPGRPEVRLRRADRALAPGDIAVLVRTNAEAADVQRALREVGVPSVVNGVGSVFATTAADDWRWLLEALERPADFRRARRFALSPWHGWSAQDLATADDDAWERLHGRLHRWGQLLREHGVAALERRANAEAAVASRLLARYGGERHVTDLRHIGELLHGAELSGDLGITSLLSWLTERQAEASTGMPDDEVARRLESDAHAVQILTVHRAKGLEYRVVLCPYLWSAGRGQSAPLAVHTPGSDRRIVDVGPRDREGFDVHLELARAEAVGEALRLLYVAVTRARHRVVLWWAAVRGSDGSPLARVLFGRDEDGGVPLEDRVDLPGADDVPGVLRQRFAADLVSVTEVPRERPVARWTPPVRDPADLQVRTFDRRLDRAWRRTSYTGIVGLATELAGGHRHDPDGAVGSEADLEITDDEPDRPNPLRTAHDPVVDLAAPGELQAVVPLGDVTGGTEFGTMVHAVLEHADFHARDLADGLRGLVEEQARRARLDVDVPRLVAGLVAAVQTPLGRLAGGERARAGGTTVAIADLADLLEHHLSADDPYRPYAQHLRRPGYHLDLRGYLTGSIDLVVRWRDADGEPTYVVADYKTNRLRWPEPPTAWDYRPVALVTAMFDHDYPLQALLYQVALHRMLRWRQPGYDPQRHLGGMLYLFLRGMTGAAVPRVDGEPCGVAAWRPPAALVTALSDLLAGERAAA